MSIAARSRFLSRFPCDQPASFFRQLPSHPLGCHSPHVGNKVPPYVGANTIKIYSGSIVTMCWILSVGDVSRHIVPQPKARAGRINNTFIVCSPRGSVNPDQRALMKRKRAGCFRSRSPIVERILSILALFTSCGSFESAAEGAHLFARAGNAFILRQTPPHVKLSGCKWHLASISL